MGIEAEQQKLLPPEPLNPQHDLGSFNSGNTQLDAWLKQRALKNQLGGASRTYVVCIQRQVVAYYCLATGAVDSSRATGRVRRNMPDPIPVIVIGRLAVDQRWQRQGLGRALLRDAVLRTLRAAQVVGIRAILVQAISQQAKRFYESCGFTVSPIDPMTLMITVADAEAIFKGDR